MKVTIIGKKKTDFTDDKGVRKLYHKVFATHKAPLDDEYSKYEGMACSEISLPEEVFELIDIDKQYLMDFDKNGKLLEVEEL